MRRQAQMERCVTEVRFFFLATSGPILHLTGTDAQLSAMIVLVDIILSC